jgi:hypothetical protein
MSDHAPRRPQNYPLGRRMYRFVAGDISQTHAVASRSPARPPGGIMRFARFVFAGAVVAAAVPLGALPAYATGPPLQSGCTTVSFNQATGQTTCTVVTTRPQGEGSVILGIPFPASTDLIPGATGQQVCSAVHGPATYSTIGPGSFDFTLTRTTTTTTVHQGVSPNGHQVSQSTVTQNGFIVVPTPSLTCST